MLVSTGSYMAPVSLARLLPLESTLSSCEAHVAACSVIGRPTLNNCALMAALC